MPCIMFHLIYVRIIGSVDILNGLIGRMEFLTAEEHYGFYYLASIKGNNPIINV